MTFKFKNGDSVRDVVTGLCGIILSRTDHLTGCNRYHVQPPISASDPSKLPDGIMFDEPMLELDTTKTRIDLEQIQAGQPPG